MKRVAKLGLIIVCSGMLMFLTSLIIQKNQIFNTEEIYTEEVNGEDNNSNNMEAFITTINIDNNSGIKGSSKIDVKTGDKVVNLVNPVKQGYTLLGYSVDKDGKNMIMTNSGSIRFVENNSPYVENYTWVYQYQELTIYAQWEKLDSKIVITTSANILKTYDFKKETLSITLSDQPSDLKYNWSFKAVGEDDFSTIGSDSPNYFVENVSDSGEYFCTISYTDNGIEKTLTSDTMTVIINPMDVSGLDDDFLVPTLGQNYTYTGKEIEILIFGVSYDGKIIPEESYKLTNNIVIDANKYKFKIIFFDNFSGSIEKEFEILPVNIENDSLFVVEAQNILTYNGFIQTQMVNVFYNNTLQDINSYTISNNQQKNASTDYKLSIEIDGNCIGLVEFSFTIHQLDISSADVTLKDDEYVYDGNYKTPIVSVSINELDVTYYIDEYTAKDAATYTIYINGEGNFKGRISRNFIIKEKLIIINADDIESIYGDKINYKYNIIDGFVNGELFEINLSVDNLDVGKKQIIATVGSNNYTIEIQNEAYLTILPRKITIKITDLSDLDGHTVNDLSYTIVSSNLAFDDTLDIQLSLPEFEEPGKYKILVNYTENSNYEITWIDGYFEYTNIFIPSEQPSDVWINYVLGTASIIVYISLAVGVVLVFKP
ncbi:MAG: hypothetical protein ACRC5M_02910 [Anaeroplasmataceae bacterium]